MRAQTGAAFDGNIAPIRLTHHAQVRVLLQDLPRPLAHEGVIFGNEHAALAHGTLSAGK